MKNKKTLYYIFAGVAAVAFGAALFFILTSQRNKEFISSVNVESVRARSAYDPTSSEDVTEETDILRLVEHFNSLELKEAEDMPSDGFDEIISVEFCYKNGKRTTLYQLGERYLRLEGGDWLEIVGGGNSTLETMLDSAKYASIRKRFPEYFNLSLVKGMDVFAWKQNGEFVYGIAPMGSLYEAGKYPTMLAPMTEDEMLRALGSYSSDEVSALISNACLFENEAKTFSYFLINDNPSPYSYYISDHVLSSDSFVITPIEGSEINGWINDSSWFVRTVEDDPIVTECNCIRLLPVFEYHSEDSREDYSYLESLFEREIAPMFKAYERPQLAFTMD